MEPVHIEIDDKSGFCFGVVRAITEAELKAFKICSRCSSTSPSTRRTMNPNRG